MASQTIVAVSPDGRYVAAQVHELLHIVEQSTGVSVALPAPVFARVADAEGDDAGADDAENGDEAAGEGGAEGEDAEAESAAKQPASKKAKHAAAADKPAAASSSSSSAAPSTAGKGQRSHDGPKPIRSLRWHPDASVPWLLYNSDEKYVHLYHRHSSYECGFKHIITVVIPRKVQACVFHPLRFSSSSTHFEPSTDSHAPRVPLRLPQLLVADKTGDVYVVGGADLATQKLELGHLANITQIEFYRAPAAAVLDATAAAAPASTTRAAAAELSVQAHAQPRNYLLTSDSDGKIRVSKSPNFFDIQAFCLGHQAFVSTFVVLPLSTPLIVSGGLGSEIFLWNLATGTKLAAFDLAPHRPGAAAASASAPSASVVPAASTSIAESVSQASYISAISLADTGVAGGEFTLAVSVYPWPQIFVLTYAPAQEAHFTVATVLPTPSTPMCLELAAPHASIPSAIAAASAASAAAAATPAPLVSPRLWYIDQQLAVHVLRRGTTCGQWKDATSSGSPEAQQAAQQTLESFSKAFAPAVAALGDTLITEANAADFIGAGTGTPKHEAQSEAQKARAAAAAAAGNTGRYISPFSSLHSSHLQRLGLLSAAGFAFRRFYDKLERDKYVSGKRAEAAARKVENKAKKTANKAANQRQKKQEAEEGGAANEH